ncbi:hypothetical protein MMO39_09010 [Acinetobacter modestus]|uniref:hypothetical protein n=1 Tax=Acinetobacter modestus TaxID=1776740 RepID=UPI001F4AD73C|nr:hypothetical protein [Acinetobacter modestus]MCH7387435.1 hypothetical protein [Acinetobacter modestus]
MHTDRPKHADNHPKSYDSGVELIRDEDIFLLLKKRYNHRWANFKDCGKEVSEGIFYETICLLENLERQLGLVYDRAYLTRDDFLVAQKNGDQKTINQIIKFYEELRVERDLIDRVLPTHSFSKNVQAYITYLKRYPDSPFWKKESGWCIGAFPHESVFTFFEKYLGDVHTGQFEESTLATEVEIAQSASDIKQHSSAESINIKKIDPVAVDLFADETKIGVFEEFEEGKKQFNQFLAKHKSLRVMCLEIKLTPQETTIKKMWGALGKKKGSLQGCFRLLADRYDLLAEYSRIEIGQNASLILQWVLLFKGHSSLDSRMVRATIKQELELQMNADDHWGTKPFKVDIRDLGRLFHLVDSKYKDVIKARSKSERQAFEYWVLGYLYCVDNFLRPNLSCIADSPYVDRHDEHSVSLGIIERPPVNNQSISHRRHQTKTDIERIDDFIDLDFSAESNKIWKKNNLPKQAKDDLRLLALLYLQYKDRLSVDYRERDNLLKLLLSIEHFMRLIQHNPVQVLIEEYLPQSQIEKSPLKCLSQQAKQYLHIGQQLKQLGLSLTEQIAELDFVGWRVRLFLQLFIEHPWGFQTNLDGRAGLEFCLGRFKDSQHYRVGDLQGSSSLIDIEKKEIVSVERNRAKAKDYLNKAIIQDVFAFRLKFTYQPNKAFTTAENVTAFNALLTDFLKNLKRTRRISGESLVAYVGTRMFIDNVLNADITLIFSAQNLSDYDEQKNEECIKQSREKVIGYWEKYLSTKELKISKSTIASTVQHLYRKVFKDENLDVSQSAMITSLSGSSDLIHIKHHDSKKLRSFKSELADFYSGHGLLCRWEFAVLENLTSIDKGHISKSMDQFLKGHVASAKIKPSKSKQVITLAQSKIEEAKCTDEEDVDNEEQVVSIEEMRSKLIQQSLDVVESIKCDI